MLSAETRVSLATSLPGNPTRQDLAASLKADSDVRETAAKVETAAVTPQHSVAMTSQLAQAYTRNPGERHTTVREPMPLKAAPTDVLTVAQMEAVIKAAEARTEAAEARGAKAEAQAAKAEAQQAITRAKQAMLEAEQRCKRETWMELENDDNEDAEEVIDFMDPDRAMEQILEGGKRMVMRIQQRVEKQVQQEELQKERRLLSLENEIQSTLTDLVMLTASEERFPKTLEELREVRDFGMPIYYDSTAMRAFESYGREEDTSAALDIAAAVRASTHSDASDEAMRACNAEVITAVLKHVKAEQLSYRKLRLRGRTEEEDDMYAVITAETLSQQVSVHGFPEAADVITCVDMPDLTNIAQLQKVVRCFTSHAVDRYVNMYGAKSHTVGIVMDAMNVVFIHWIYWRDTDKAETLHFSFHVSPPLHLLQSESAAGSGAAEGLLQLMRLFRMAAIAPDKLVGFRPAALQPRIIQLRFTRLRFVETLGEGRFSRVLRYDVDGEPCALKLPKNRKGAMVDPLEVERRVLRRLADLKVQRIPRMPDEGSAIVQLRGKLPFLILHPVFQPLDKVLDQQHTVHRRFSNLMSGASTSLSSQQMWSATNASPLRINSSVLQIAGEVWEQISAVLKAAAAHGIHHQDVKAANIGVTLDTAENKWYLFDWGSAMEVSLNPALNSIAQDPVTPAKNHVAASSDGLHVPNTNTSDDLRVDLTALAHVVAVASAVLVGANIPALTTPMNGVHAATSSSVCEIFKAIVDNAWSTGLEPVWAREVLDMLSHATRDDDTDTTTTGDTKSDTASSPESVRTSKTAPLMSIE